MKYSVATVLVCAMVAATSVSAQSISTKNKLILFKNKTRVLDERASQQYSNSVRLQPSKVITPTKYATQDFGASNPKYKGKYRGPYVEMARAAARRHGVPEDLFLRLINQESRFNAKARSHKGAIGLAQLMPGTAKVLRVNPHDPYQNLDGGARYLKEQYHTFKSWRLALAAYNAGPAAVQKYGGIPPYRETKNYVRKIMGS